MSSSYFHSLPSYPERTLAIMILFFKRFPISTRLFDMILIRYENINFIVEFVNTMISLSSGRVLRSGGGTASIYSGLYYISFFLIKNWIDFKTGGTVLVLKSLSVFSMITGMIILLP